MTLEIRTATNDDLDRWDALVARSPQATPFHYIGALDVLAEHSNATLHPLIGYKGQEPVGLFPLFEISKGPIQTVFSPPPQLKVPYLGPVQLNHEKLKQRKAESDREKFIDGCMAYVEEVISPAYSYLRSGTRYDDVRALSWHDFDVTPRYTYMVDLTQGADALLAAFSSDARKNVTADYAIDYEVYEGGRDDIAPIIAQVRARHEAQGEPYPVTAAFVEDLYDATPEGTVRPYVCTVDGTFAGGMVTVEVGDTSYRWQGGAKTDADLPINDLVDWQIMRDGIDRGLARYDLVGANTQRLNGYKAKFAPELATYYQMEKSSWPVHLAATVYARLLRRTGSRQRHESPGGGDAPRMRSALQRDY
ncbi:GNAT family N-acetyltransferase [Halorarius litoreus]|uniref:GNAT family N-acetyltransferase n=1 Tax=Halorarius litoreus TaxID=2962676 RepID=UPI0020CB8E08|nr:GNAT family N-acetyltransferase [Halorarius litoreus]